MKKDIGTILILASIGMLFYIIFNQKQHIRTLQSSKPNVDSLYKVIDSLNSEIFIEHTTVDRYEIAIERLREENSQAADQFEECLKNIE
jgi:hypothetical protein